MQCCSLACGKSLFTPKCDDQSNQYAVQNGRLLTSFKHVAVQKKFSDWKMQTIENYWDCCEDQSVSLKAEAGGDWVIVGLQPDLVKISAAERDEYHWRNRAKKFTNYRTREPSGEVDKAKRSKNRSQSKIHAPGGARLWGGKTLVGLYERPLPGSVQECVRAFTALALANIYLSCHTGAASVVGE